MKEHQKCKEKNYFSLEKDTLLKLQQRKLKKNKSKSFKKSWVMLTEQPKRSHELSKWYKMSNWRLVCRNHDFHKKRSPIYGLKNFCLIVKWRNCLKKSFWNIAAKLKRELSMSGRRRSATFERTKKKKREDVDWRKEKERKINHLPSLLPLLTDFWSWLKWVRLVLMILVKSQLFFNFCVCRATEARGLTGPRFTRSSDRCLQVTISLIMDCKSNEKCAS